MNHFYHPGLSSREAPKVPVDQHFHVASRSSTQVSGDTHILPWRTTFRSNLSDWGMSQWVEHLPSRPEGWIPLPAPQILGTPAIPALKRWRQEDQRVKVIRFKASLGYTGPCLKSSNLSDPVSDNRKLTFLTTPSYNHPFYWARRHQQLRKDFTFLTCMCQAEQKTLCKYSKNRAPQKSSSLGSFQQI